MLPHDVQAIRESLNDAKAEAETCSEAISGVEDSVRDALNKLNALELGSDSEVIPSHQCHFIIKVDDLAQALLDGRVPSRPMNGGGTTDDARKQAMAMLAACNMYL